MSSSLEVPWACPQCTFENAPQLTSCQMCQAARPVSAVPPPNNYHNDNIPKQQDSNNNAGGGGGGALGAAAFAPPSTTGGDGGGALGQAAASGYPQFSPVGSGGGSNNLSAANTINNNNNNTDPVPTAGPNEWVCPACTLINNSMLAKCNACGGDRPASVVPMGPWVRYEMTQNEYDHLVAVFYRFLRGDNTRMSREEMKSLCRFLNFAHTDDQINAMFAEMDHDRTGRLSCDEFMAWSARHRPDPTSLYGMTQPEYHAVLFSMDKYDRNHDGYLSREECIAMALDKGFAKTLEQAQQICTAVDIDGDGKITLHELLVCHANIKNGIFRLPGSS